MNTKKSLVVAAVVATVGVGTAAVPTLVSAETNAGGNPNSLVDKLAQKFNLKKDEVQAVFDEEHAAHKAEMEKRTSEKLQKAVDEGKLTAEQKTLIENKIKELHAARETEVNELKAWAEQNKVNVKFIFAGLKHGEDLDDAVDAGTITAEQKTLIENKRKELESKREAAHEALKKWADDNNIDEKYLMGMGGPGHKMMVKHL